MVKYRGGRVNEEVKKAVSNIIMNEIRDPRLTAMVSVTNVEVTKDLGYAKVYISVFGTEEQKKETLAILRNSAGFIRREVGHEVKLRTVPQMLFELDNSIEQGMHIDALLHKIKETSHDDSE
ncbi:MAG: 30S ribosome-binding factor RbfA [Bacillota bacterium]|nr:30S ribosome-binding factor RbfA [Bacillota bacterium]